MEPKAEEQDSQHATSDNHSPDPRSDGLEDKESTHNSEPEGSQPSDPAERIEAFDWGDLFERYQTRIQLLGETEQGLYEDFNRLMQYFTVWQEASGTHEVERSAKRLQTRAFHVQCSEAQLEEKRLHYQRVVDAFQSALQLLNG